MGSPDAGTGWSQPGGWLFNVMPYIEESTLYKAQQGLTGTLLKAAAIRVAQTPLAAMYCPSRRPVQTYPQNSVLPNINPTTMAIVTSLLGVLRLSSPMTPVRPRHPRA